MNAHETRALWEMGRDAWNDWASQILKSKANFQEAGALALNWFGEADNDETRLWLKVASADFANGHFEDEITFDGFIFPGSLNLSGAVFERPVSFAGAEFQLPAKFGRAHFQADAHFKSAKFLGQTIFDDAVFDGIADFEHAEFLKEKNGPLTHGAKFQRTRFVGKADFRTSVFVGSADFSKVQFAGTARFDETRFTADAMFEGAVFSAPAGFNACQFLGTAVFKEAQFTGEARFSEASFKGECQLDRSQFWGDVSFREARFEGDASFADMRVEGTSRFPAAKFAMEANFLESRFSGNADFSGADFGGSSIFRFAHFGHGASWTSCRFLTRADFSGLTLGRNSSFKDSQFDGDAIFREARFDAPVSFARTRFGAIADFSALQSNVAFVLANADFKNVPSFLEASFHEPPRVDHMLVADPLKRFHNWKQAGAADPRGPFFKLMKVCADPDASAKFRRLKKLAFEAQDQTREQEFFAQEFRCRRFWHDKPFGQGVARFWLGWFYGGVANHGRSLLRPFMLWLLSIAVFAFYYLSQRGVAAGDHAPYSGIAQYLGGLFSTEKAPCIAAPSNPMGEALYLSFRNAFLKIDWEDTTTARRVFGCLYGVEPGGNAIVPLSVSSVSLFQAVMSAALIFMFLLALRNLLKVR
jgi:uncharacterized protein YjbI with pentapeptide repeats